MTLNDLEDYVEVMEAAEMKRLNIETNGEQSGENEGKKRGIAGKMVFVGGLDKNADGWPLLPDDLIVTGREAHPLSYRVDVCREFIRESYRRCSG